VVSQFVNSTLCQGASTQLTLRQAFKTPGVFHRHMLPILLFEKIAAGAFANDILHHTQLWKSLYAWSVQGRPQVCTPVCYAPCTWRVCWTILEQEPEQV